MKESCEYYKQCYISIYSDAFLLKQLIPMQENHDIPTLLVVIKYNTDVPVIVILLIITYQQCSILNLEHFSQT